ncbi:MAG: CPBP family intramembrane metalloprotease [Chloroflexi bacterium]|nr:CPBP family intramembrane metalloprotease [Chloroflexota bacterium]
MGTGRRGDAGRGLPPPRLPVSASPCPRVPLKRLVGTALEALACPERAVHRTILASVLAVLALSNLVALPLFRLLHPAGGIHSLPGFLIAALAQEGTLLAFVGLAWALRARRAMGPTWRAPGRLPARLLAGLAAGPLLFLVSVLVQVAMAEAFGVRQTQLAGYLWARELDLPQLLLVLLVGAVLAPIAEELFFRGFVFRAYLVARGARWAYPLSAALFALLHVNLPAALPIFAMGLLLAWLCHRNRSVVPGIVAHGFNNAVALLLLYFAPMPP